MKNKILLSIKAVMFCLVLILGLGLNNIIKEKKLNKEVKNTNLTLEEASETTAETTAVLDTIKSFTDNDDYPYFDFDFVDENAYNLIKNTYDNLDFTSEFKKGNLELYDLYKNKFNKLFNDEMTFYFPEEDEDIYISEYYAKYTNDDIKKDICASFYFYDIDDDDTPELCVAAPRPGISVFKYIQNEDKFILWYNIESTNHSFHGTKAVTWQRWGAKLQDSFYKLNDNGEYDWRTYFFCVPYHNEKNNKDEFLCIVTLPILQEKPQIYQLDLELQKQGYYNKYNELFYFRVTEEQYKDITKNYYEAHELAYKKRKEIKYSYDEFFVDLSVS